MHFQDKPSTHVTLVAATDALFADGELEGKVRHLVKENTLESLIQDVYLERRGLHRGPIPRDGNCLFRAVAQALYGDQSLHRDVRSAVVKSLSDNWDTMKHQLGECEKEDYVRTMERDTTYGGEPEIATLCSVYRIFIQVFTGGLHYDIRRLEYGDSSHVQVTMVYLSDGQYDSGHYDLVVSNTEQLEPIKAHYDEWRRERVAELKEIGDWNNSGKYGTWKKILVRNSNQV